MPVESRIKKVPFRDQVADVQRITTLGDYESLYDKYFQTDNSDWTIYVGRELRRPDVTTPRDSLLQMTGLVTILFAQYGFPKMDGWQDRHKKYQWDESFLDPKHQLAMAVYAADLNVKSYPKKRALREEVDPANADGVWGINLATSRGEVHTTTLREHTLHMKIRNRVRDGVPVALPYNRINNRLAAIKFTGVDAETMPDDEFSETIVPQAKKALGTIIKTGDLFVVKR